MIELIAMEKYKDLLKDKILFDHFNLKDYILGPEIKQLTPIPQINSFVVRRLFEKWQNEAEQLKSNFFDYEHEEVKQALKDFLAKLSFHIKVDKDHFESILKVALNDVFEYIKNPIFFLQETFFHFDQHIIQCSEITSKLKFLKFYTHEISLLKQHEKLSNETIHLEHFYALLEDVFEHANREQEEKTFIYDFESQILKTHLNKEEDSITDLEFHNHEEPKTQSHEPEVEEVFPNKEEEESILEEQEEKASETISYTETEVPEQQTVPLYEKFEPTKIVYEDHKGPETASFSPIKNMTDGVSLHQKYFFIRELFNGDSNMYDYVIEKLDEHNSYENASNFLLDNYAEKLSWHEKEESVSDFFSILNRRFL